jgi:hypothetical protein
MFWGNFFPQHLAIISQNQEKKQSKMFKPFDGLKQKSPNFATFVSRCSCGLSLPAETITISIQVYGMK